MAAPVGIKKGKTYASYLFYAYVLLLKFGFKIGFHGFAHF